MGLAVRANKDLAPFFRRLPSDFSTFVPRGTTLVRIYDRHLLGGFCFDLAMGDKSLRWVHYFVQPLYVPKSYIALSWGDRIPQSPPGILLSHQPQYIKHEDERMVEGTIQVMREFGLPNLDAMSTVKRFYELVNRRNWTHMGHLWAYETLASGALLLGRAEASKKHIAEAFAYAQSLGFKDFDTARLELKRSMGGRPLQEWNIQILERLSSLRKRLEDKDFKAALTLIRRWEDESIAGLGIESLMPSVSEQGGHEPD